MKAGKFLGMALAAACLAASAMAGGTVHVTGGVRNMKGGDYVQVRYPGATLHMPTSYAQYQLDVPYGVIVTAMVRDSAGNAVSGAVSGAAWDRKDGGDAKNGAMAMPVLVRR